MIIPLEISNFNEQKDKQFLTSNLSFGYQIYTASNEYDLISPITVSLRLEVQTNVDIVSEELFFGLTLLGIS